MEAGSPASVSSHPRLALLVRGLAVGVGMMPLLVWAFGGTPVLGTLLAPFAAWYDYHCHREAARSAEWLGRWLPVCHRCLGIYLGLGLGALVLRPRLAFWPLRIWVAVAALAMVLDVATETVGLRGPSAALRLATGVFLAWPVGILVVLGLRGD